DPVRARPDPPPRPTHPRRLWPAAGLWPRPDDGERVGAVVKTASSTLAGVRGSRIYTQSWLPDGPPRAALLLVHGLGEHCGRYQNVVDHLVPLGYAVYGLDHLGHGQSGGQREYVDRFTDYTQTLKIYFDQIRALQPAPLPIF